jgi:predicted MFS family arabinose efflux permease
VPPFPVWLVAWAGLGIALNIGIARFTYGVMLPALQRDLELDYFGGGALNAVHLLGYLAGTLVAPLLARGLGMARLSRGAHWLVAAGALVCALAPASPGMGAALLALGRLATGLGAGAGVVAILVIAFSAVPAAARPMVSALVWSGMGFAVVLSGIAAPALVESEAGWRAAFLASAALAALLALGFPPRGFAAGAVQAIPAPGAVRLRMRQLLRARWSFLIAVYFMFGAGYIAYSTFAGTRLAAQNASLAVVSGMWIAFGAAMIAGAGASFAVLRLEGRRKLALIAASLAAALGALASTGDTASAALAGALLVGLGLAATPTIVSAYARERCSEADYPHAFSFATAAMGIGQLLGPLAAGALADRFGVAAVALFALGAYALGTALALLDALANRAGAPLEGR